MSTLFPERSYKVAVKDQVITALRSVFASDFPDPELANRVQIMLDYPTLELHYPSIFVGFQEESIHIAGVGHREIDQVSGKIVAHWRFEGQLTFTIFALSNLERDLLSGYIVNIIAFRSENGAYSRFSDEIYNGGFIDMQTGMDQVTPGGEEIGDVPWDDPTRKLYQATYSIPVVGEFYTHDDTGQLVTIGDVQLYPYRADQPIPLGSQKPQDKDISWSGD